MAYELGRVLVTLTFRTLFSISPRVGALCLLSVSRAASPSSFLMRKLRHGAGREGGLRSARPFLHVRPHWSRVNFQARLV